MIRVLQSVSNMDRAGIETMLMNYYRTIDKSKIQFDFICNKKVKGAYDDEIQQLGGNIYYSPGFNPLKIKKYIKFLKEIKSNNKDIKIIHAHNGALSAYTLYCAKKAGFDIRIAHSHSTEIPHSKRIKYFDLKWLYKSILKRFVRKNSTFNIACGKDAGDFLFGKDNYVLIKNGINTNKFLFSEEKRKKIRNLHGLKQSDILIGHVGRFNIVKNHGFMLKIIKELNKLGLKKYKLMFVGDGELKDQIKKIIEFENLENNVKIVDSVSNVDEYYSAFDLFILPSFFEGIPVVGIEAQVSGLKCLFSKNVSYEAKLFKNTKYISIEEKNSLEEWINEIKTFSSDYNREIDKDIVIKSGYDIDNNKNSLVEIYVTNSKNAK